MYKVWSVLKKSLVVRHFGACCLGVFFAGQATAQVKRSPASYLPDDDVIVKPVDNEISFYHRYVESDASEEVVLSRNQLKVWNDNQIYADQYGIDNSAVGSTFYVPTQAEKLEYFKSRYMRYLRGRSEQPLKSMPQQWYNQYRATNEIDTIDELETKFKNSNKNSAVTGRSLPTALQAKEVSLWKNTKIIFQPRLDQGLVIMGFRTANIYARAWVGVNGRTEFNVQQNYASLGLRIMGNYYVDKGKYFTSVDKHLYRDVWARATSTIDRNHAVGAPAEDNSFMLLYAKQF